ncbi:MAG: PAS domain S-box protein [Cyanobacteria bacterium RM1_2_2]|nr:PAS domain S-box protein [Cyanobacteria bacterium RM1_2_2]
MTKRHRTFLLIHSFSEQILHWEALFTGLEGECTVLPQSIEEGISACRRQLPDAIILSFELPEPTDLASITALKTEFGAACPPIVVVADYGNEKIVVQAIKNGATDFLNQPTPHELQTALENAIEETAQQNFAQTAETDLYRTIVEAQTDLICRFLPNGQITFVNQACCRCFDLSSAALVGRHFFSLLTADQALMNQRLEALSCLTPAQPLVDYEYAVLTPDGQQWQHWVYRGTFDGNGQLAVVQAVGRDITPRKQAEAVLQKSQELLELAATAVDCLIYDWDFPTQTVERSRGLTQLLGYTPEEVGNSLQWWNEQIHPEDLLVMQNEATANLATGDRYFYEYRVRHKNGHYLWVQDQGVLVRDGAGQLIRIVGSTTDIDDRKRAEEALRQSETRFRRLAESNLWGHVLAF